MMIIFVFLGLTLSCNYQNKLTRNNKAGRYYKILRIESLDNIYIIYAQKEDSLFKILSLKSGNKNCNTIKVNKSYPLKLKSLFPKEFLGKYDLSPQATNVDGVNFYGNMVQVERDSINDLTTAENIRGLCFIKN